MSIKSRTVWATIILFALGMIAAACSGIASEQVTAASGSESETAQSAGNGDRDNDDDKDDDKDKDDNRDGDKHEDKDKDNNRDGDKHVLYNTPDSIAPPGVPVEDYFDVPASAVGPPIPDSGYLVEEINDGVYWITEGAYQLMFVITDDGVIVADAPPTIGDNILNAIADVTDQPITHVIYSHSHIDHIGAAGLYPADAEVIAHRETRIELEQADDPNRPVPTTVFDDTYTLEVGGKRLELIYPGNNHEPGNIFIHAPDEGVMMAIDLIFPGWMPWRRLALAEDVPGFIVASEALLDYEWDTLVAGHVTRLGTRDDVELQNEFVRDLEVAAGTALATVQVPDVVGRLSPEDIQPWAIFDGFIDDVAAQCVAELTPKWGDQLAAYDVFIWDQCFAMEQSLRID